MCRGLDDSAPSDERFSVGSERQREQERCPEKPRPQETHTGAAVHGVAFRYGCAEQNAPVRCIVAELRICTCARGCRRYRLGRLRQVPTGFVTTASTTK